MAINTEKLRAPLMIFFIYIIAASFFIFLFRFIFPGVEAPLIIYSRTWRMLQGWLEILNLFPALALSALVIPFGLAEYEEKYQSFSDVFFKRILSSVVTAIFASVLFAIVYFLAYPTAKNYEDDLRFSGDLYQIAKKNAFSNAEAGRWYDASRFADTCDHIWFESEDIKKLRDRITINLERLYFEEREERDLARASLLESRQDSEVFALSEGQGPVDATEAIELCVKAFNDKRFYDAHWLANLASRLAPRGSAQQMNAIRLASESWNMIASQAPNQREERLFALYNLKISGYQAMNAERWIDAYYIFRELLSQTPDDPDAVNFLAVSERNARQTAFFADEINLTLGETINGSLFSLPAADGRAILRFSALTTSADVSYGMDLEYMKFDSKSNLLESAVSRYAKILPFSSNNRPQIIVLTHALDREHQEKGFEGEWLIGEKSAGGILLDVSYDIFLLVTQVRHGLTNLQVNELYQASKKLESTGYISRIFQAEILNRLGTVIFFLPLAIFTIIIAWRYRAKTKPRYLFVLLLPILPIVFHCMVFLYRSVFNTLGIWLVITFGFIPAFIIFIAAFTVLLVISLISLAAQRS